MLERLGASFLFFLGAHLPPKLNKRNPQIKKCELQMWLWVFLLLAAVKSSPK
jgi:hypothetical protein